jgi:hypothetical protein
MVSFGAASSQFFEEVYLPWVPRGFPPPTPTSRPTRLLLTEFMADPIGVEPDHEWVEVYNPGFTPLDLSGYKLGDAESPGKAEGMYRFPESRMLPPETSLVIANKASAFYAVFGVNPDFELRESDAQVPNLEKYLSWGLRDLEMVNSGDELLLLDANDQAVDKVSWGSSTYAFNPSLMRSPQGASWGRRLGYEDTNRAEDWILQDQPDPWNADLSTPTPASTSTPPPTWTLTPTPIPTLTPTPSGRFKMLISEVLPYPAGVAEPDGEWIELYNGGEWTVCLEGLRLGDEETQGEGEGMYLFPAGECVPPGAMGLIAYRADVFQSVAGFVPHYEIVESDPQVPNLIKDTSWASGSLSLNNSGDEVLLIGLDGVLLDSMSWGNSRWAFAPAIPAPGQGVSLERYPSEQDTDTAQDWRLQNEPSPGEQPAPPTPTPTASATATDTATATATPSPEVFTVTPLPTGDGSALVLNEIHADPDNLLGDANGDGQVDPTEDEFLEIVNAGAGPVNLSDWRLEVGFNLLVHRFPEDTWLEPGRAIVIFGGGEPQGAFGGSLVQIASSGSLNLMNTGDLVTLRRGDGNVVFTLSYGLKAGDDQSITRSPDLTGGEPLVKHGLAEGSGGSLFSPGTRLDGSLFVYVRR